MRESISISLPTNLKKELDRLMKDEGMSRSDVVRASLKEYLFHRRFRELRAKVTAKAHERGIFTDEDVFRQIS